MVTILALAAAVLYGTADFLGGVASRRASVFAVLAMTVPITVCVGTFAPDLVSVLLGPQWQQVETLVRLLDFTSSCRRIKAQHVESFCR